jgi:integrase
LAEAADNWLKASAAASLERSTLTGYREYVTLHIVPFLGTRKLADVTAPLVRQFQDVLQANGRSTNTISRATKTLGSILADAQERGQVGHNAVRELSRNRRRGQHVEKRRRGRLKVGVDIPSPDEITALVAGTGRWRPFLIVAAFTGLRASELRGLRWCDVELDASRLHVRQRADRFNQIGSPKSAAGHRTVPFGKLVRNTLREWKLACPPSALDLVFPSRTGKVIDLPNIRRRGLIPAQGGHDKAKYTGMHCLRHFYASWCINSESDGGLGLPPKVVQERLGHSTISMTMDVYGHLFPAGDDTDKLDAAELRLVPLKA